ncbi:MAG: Uma2 family endonuclease [Pirellulales bacterium]
MATVTSLLTAEEYMALPDSFDGPTELVKRVLVTMPPARPRHGQICAQIVYLLRRYLEDHPIGHVVSNDSSMLTERDPDSVRGPDVAYYSFERVPQGPLPAGLLPVAAELVFEVRSPNDRWSELHAKVAEYLAVGVRSVCVLDDETKSVHSFHAERANEIFEADDELTLPDLLHDFRVVVQQFVA